MIKLARSQSQVISIIYTKLESDDSLAYHFGPWYNLVTIHPGGSEVHISTINSTLNPLDCEYIKTYVDPHKDFPIAYPDQTSGNQGSSPAIQYLTSFLSDNIVGVVDLQLLFAR